MLFGVKVGKKWIQKNTAKTYLQKSHARDLGDPGKSGPGSYGPLKQFKDSQIPGLLNLTKALETLHWCLAARWRILQMSTAPIYNHNFFLLFSKNLKRYKEKERENGKCQKHVVNKNIYGRTNVEHTSQNGISPF